MIISVMAKIEGNSRQHLEAIHYNVKIGGISDGHEEGESFVVSFTDLERMVEAIRVVKDGK